MTNADLFELITRIALALERQVAQQDESVSRQLTWRAENVSRHDRERDAELNEARETNARLLAQLESAIAINNSVAARYLQPTE